MNEIKPGLRFVFTSPYTVYEDRRGQEAIVVGPLDPQDYDEDEVGPMFRIRFMDGEEIDAWPEEIDSSLIIGGVAT